MNAEALPVYLVGSRAGYLSDILMSYEFLIYHHLWSLYIVVTATGFPPSTQTPGVTIYFYG